MTDAWAIRLLLALALLHPAGCAATTQAGDAAPSRGFALEMLVRDAGQSNSLYRVNTDRAMEWAGGYDAVNRKIAWKGMLTDADVEELTATLRGNGWFDGAPRADAGAAEAKAKFPEYEARLRGPGVNRRYHIKGTSSQMEAVREVLERFARRRHDPFLESLPRPGLQDR